MELGAVVPPGATLLQSMVLMQQERIGQLEADVAKLEAHLAPRPALGSGTVSPISPPTLTPAPTPTPTPLPLPLQPPAPTQTPLPLQPPAPPREVLGCSS
jgi:hypothetical protein